MLSNSAPDSASSIIDRDALHALGVLVPIQFHPVKVLPGRHPLGRAGDGMRLLRTRPYVPGEDNPRDIDKFSPPGDLQVMEWEDEAQASITLLVDTSASMQTELKSPLQSACVLQLIYSLWRAGDRVGVATFDTQLREPIRAANLRTQISATAAALRHPRAAAATDVSTILNDFVRLDRRRHSNLLFVLSDFVTPDDRVLNPEVEWNNAINEIHRNIVPVIISFELHDDIGGLVKLHDVESAARRMVWFTRDRVSRINRDERLRVAALMRKFRAAGLDCIYVRQQREIYPQLTRLARVRRHRKS
ncbi:MAG: DUF58 domain-containing protein [Gammaproteobacteria bacterium]|nr:DUF58 domain-containing protein [Gammaproteobacteria bacterium]